MEQKKANVVEVVEEVRAKRLVIVDDEGHERIKIDCDYGNPHVDFYNTKGIYIGSIGTHDVGADSHIEEISEFHIMAQDDHENLLLWMGTRSTPDGRKVTFDVFSGCGNGAKDMLIARDEVQEMARQAVDNAIAGALGRLFGLGAGIAEREKAVAAEN